MATIKLDLKLNVSFRLNDLEVSRLKSFGLINAIGTVITIEGAPHFDEQEVFELARSGETLLDHISNYKRYNVFWYNTDEKRTFKFDLHDNLNVIDAYYEIEQVTFEAADIRRLHILIAQHKQKMIEQLKPKLNLTDNVLFGIDFKLSDSKYSLFREATEHNLFWSSVIS